MFTPERHPPHQHQDSAGTWHIPQQNTAAGTAAPTTTDTGNTAPQRVNPTQTAYARPKKGTDRTFETGAGGAPYTGNSER